MAYNRCVGSGIVLTTALIKCVVLTGSLYNKNSEFDYHMNDPRAYGIKPGC
jgi:hypothetical protein